jgi:cell division protein FtsB
VRARGAVVLTLLGVMLLSALYPLRQYASQDSHVSQLVRQERVLAAKIASLKQQQSLLLSDDEIERIAREELGMVRPGEVAFAIVGSRQAAPKATIDRPAGEEEPAVTHDAWYARWWDAVSRAATGMR